jgi:hypothetical protein
VVDVNAKTPVFMEKELQDILLDDKRSATVEGLHSKLKLERSAHNIESGLANIRHPKKKEFSMASDLEQVKPIVERSATSAM